MAITFFTQSVKQIAPVWIRYRELNIDAKARTSIYVDRDRLKNSKVLKFKMTAKDNQEEKLLIKEKNKALDKVQNEMQLLEIRIRSLVTHNTRIDSAWLKQAMRPPEEIVKLTLLDYYEKLLESNSTLAKNTQKAYKVNASFMLRYQKHLGKELQVSDIDGNFKDAFVKYCRDNGYPESTLKGQLQRLKAVCNYAEQRGEVISNQVKNLSKGIKKQPTQSVFLTTSEIDDIIALELDDKSLDVARDWLVVSCYIGQRSVSLLKLTNENIDIKTNTIRLQQVKTKANVVLPILKPVEAILEKYNGNFPDRFSDNVYQNYSRYNTLIKDVCKLAGITEMVKGRVTAVVDRTKKVKGVDIPVESRKNTIVEKPKYNFVTSHIGRKSFATNFYDKIPLQTLMQCTGHLTESSFLIYINRNRAIDTNALNKVFLNAMK